jgi:hypothetical protein
MKSPLIVTKEAEEDLAEARSWYHRQRDGLDEEFVLCVEEALDRISRMPEAAEEVYRAFVKSSCDDFRIASTPRWNRRTSQSLPFTIASATREADRAHRE